MSIFPHTSICWQPVLCCSPRPTQGQVAADSCSWLPPLVLALAEDPYSHLPLPEISVFIAGQGYSRPVSLAHGIILPNSQSQHIATYSFTCAPLTRGKGGRRVRGNGRSDTKPSREIQIRQFWVAGLLLQPFSKEKAFSRKPVLQYKVFEWRFPITLANTPKYEQFWRQPPPLTGEKAVPLET